MRNSWFLLGLAACLAFVCLGVGTTLGQAPSIAWSSSATNGNWNDAANWDGAQTPPGSEVLTFGNNAQLAMTNDAANTTRHRIVFGSSATTARTIAGTTANLFVAVSGNAPMIQNNAAVVHTLAFPIEVGADGLIFDTVNGALNINGAISGSGTITKTGGGSGGISGNPQNVVITADNSGFTGKWVVTGGNLSINADAALGAAPGFAVADAITLNGGSLTNMSSPSGGGFGAGHDLSLHANRGITLGSNGGNIRIGYTRTVTVPGAISGVGRLSISDNGILMLTNLSNTYQGGTSVSGTATLQIVADGSLGQLPASFVANNIQLNGGAMLSNHSSADVVVNANRGILINSGTDNVARLSSQGTGKSLTVEGVVSGSGGLIIATGAGTVILTGANTYTGGTTIVSGGRLSIGNGGATGSIVGNIANAGALIVNRSEDWTYGGVISGAGTLTKSGTGALALSEANTYTGRTTVTGGSLRIAADSGLGVAPATFVADQLTLNGGELMNLDSNTVISATRGIVLGASGGQLRAGWSKSLEVASVISGAGALTIVDNSGTVTLSGANTYTGATSIQAALKLQGGDNRLPVATSIALSDASRATLDLGGVNQTVRWLTGGGASGGSVVNTGATTSTLTLNLGLSGSRIFNGTISGDIRVAVTNSTGKNTDVQVFTRANSYTGGTVIDNGHLRVASDSYLGAVPVAFDPDNIVLKNGGVLQNHDTNLVLDGNRGIFLEQGNGVFYTGWNKTITVNGVISGAGRLVKADGGSLILAAANIHTGDTAIQSYGSGSRAIVLRHQDALQYSTFDATIMGGTGDSVLDLDGRTIVLGGLKGTGVTISNFTGQLSIGNNHQDTVFSGMLSGTGSLVKIGNGSLTLAGTNAYTGATAVDSGMLLVTGALSGTSGVQVNAGGTLGGSGVIHSTIRGAGLVAPGASAGILTVTQVDPSDSLRFAFEFGRTGDPDWSNAAASGNDVLRITSPTAPLTASLTSDNVVNVYFDVNDVAPGDVFRGGFFSDASADFLDLLGADTAAYNYFVLGDGQGGAATYNGNSYYALSDWKSWLSVELSTPTVSEAAFATGAVLNGRVSQFAVVPEPSALLMGLAAIAMLLGRRRR